jgi:hypothetical protein
MKGQCKDCRHVDVGVPVGSIRPPLTCTNWPGADGRWLIVEPDSWCENFKPKYEADEPPKLDKYEIRFLTDEPNPKQQF